MTVYPLILRLGPIELTGYGLMMMVAFLMAGWAMQLELRRRKLDEEFAADIVIAGVGATAAILLNGWRRRVPVRFTVEVCAAPLALGYALGRVGCFLVNDDYGIPTSLPWGMRFPHGLPPTTVANLTALGIKFPPVADPMQVVAVHPTQIYETVLMLLAFWWMWRRRDHGHAVGWMVGCYLVLGGLERFLVEFVRAKDDRLLGPFTLAQATSVALVIVGAALLKVWWRPDATMVSVPTLTPPARGSGGAPAT